MNEAERELISAHFDGELDEPRRAEAERLLADDVECRRWWDELAALRDTLRSLPASSLDDDLADRVLRQAERAMFTVDAPAVAARSQRSVPRHLAAARGDDEPGGTVHADVAPRTGWFTEQRVLLGTVATLAALLLVVVLVRRDTEDTVALVPKKDGTEQDRLATPTNDATASAAVPAEALANDGEAAETRGATARARSELRPMSKGGAGEANPGLASDGPMRSRAAGVATTGAPADDDTLNAHDDRGQAAGPSPSATGGARYSKGGYGGAGYGGDGYGYSGGYYGNLPGANAGSSPEELGRRLAVEAAQRPVYVVEVDVPPGPLGDERLNTVLANQMVVTAQTNSAASPQPARADVDVFSLDLDVQTAAEDASQRDAKEVADDSSLRYYYAEMTPQQLQAAVTDLKSSSDVFRNVAMLDVASNRLDVNSLGRDAPPASVEVSATNTGRSQ
ncbi:MAG: hypothetical protein R3C10_05485 [Pirellulales bacterium]